jgi:hypothetical protein
MKPLLKAILIILGVLLISLFIIRTNSSREIDDVTPGIPCEQEYLQKADVLWVIPYWDKIPISDNQTWCNEIIALNKTIGMHGISHQPFKEFNGNISQAQMNKAIEIFEKCFGYAPEMFKPPQLTITEKNLKLIKLYNLKYKGALNQAFHKVYHCNDTGILPNSFHDVF